MMVQLETIRFLKKTSKKRKSSRDSRKLDNSYCLARMYVKQHHPTGKVEVTYISTHTNHSLGVKECKYLPLPLTVRKEIQEKFAQGVTLERIMDGKNACVYNYSYKQIKILTYAFYNYDTGIRADIGGRHQHHNFEKMAS